MLAALTSKKESNLLKYILVILSTLLACKVYSETIFEGIEQAVINTPITVIAKNKSVNISKTDNGFTALVSAEVVQTIKGTLSGDFNYVIVGQPGDEPSINNKEILISLCKDQGKLYHAGVGTEFKATKQAITQAKNVAKNNKSSSGFTYCN